MKTNHFFLLACTFLLLTYSCTENTNDNLEMGRLKVVMTDAPFPFDQVSEANVTVFKIDARLKDSGEIELDTEVTDEDSGQNSPFVVLMEEEISMNLLELTNGNTETMANLDVPVGTYDLVRVYVKGVNVVLRNGNTYELKVPSGEQTGIKVFITPGLTVVGGLSSDLLLDFDVSRSFIAKGNPRVEGGIKGFNFKPVIKACNISVAGTLAGNVSTLVEESLVGLEGAQVKVFNETDTTATFTDLDGNYMIMGLTAGAYRSVAEVDGYLGSDTMDIQINVANKTVLDFTLEEEEVPAETTALTGM
ncbi:DUF4382 domain-containing protein [Maribacter sp. CXY002]|uniref:DUF4382 domain-containing protein n=1 Tax=Maribacter luteocoastalis TaxID=3407671 RepID=UPI003B6744B9